MSYYFKHSKWVRNREREVGWLKRNGYESNVYVKHDRVFVELDEQELALLLRGYTAHRVSVTPGGTMKVPSGRSPSPELDRKAKEREQRRLGLSVGRPTQQGAASEPDLPARVHEELERSCQRVLAAIRSGESRPGRVNKSITLKKKLARRLEVEGFCNSCHRNHRGLWRLEHTFDGIVEFVCDTCKTLVYGRSFGSAGDDAMFRAVGRRRNKPRIR